MSNTKLCTLHNTEGSTYCLSCKRNLCTKCANSGTHRDHSIVTQQKYQQFVSSNVKDMGKIAFATKLPSIREAINKHIDKLIQQYKTITESMATKLTQITKSKIDTQIILGIIPNTNMLYANTIQNELNILKDGLSNILDEQPEEKPKIIIMHSKYTSSPMVFHHPFSILKDQYVHYIKGINCVIYDHSLKSKKYIELQCPINKYADTISINYRIFVLGSYPLNPRMLEVDIDNKTFIEKSPMKCGKVGHSLCTSDGYIFSIGGTTSPMINSIDECEQYDIQFNSWISLPALNTSRAYCASWVKHNSVYAYCGWNEKLNEINSLEKLNLSDHKWEQLKPKLGTPLIRCLQAVAMEDGVFIVGGYQCNKAV